MLRLRIPSQSLRAIDLVPALSGLIGKTALVTSFALMWASQLHITNPDFVFENVRIEMIIGSAITLIAALFLPNTAPSGTLAPLIVLIPSMAAFGVHPLMLSLLSGIFGIIAIRTRIFHKIMALSGLVSKTSLTLTIGISGIILSIRNMHSFFGEKQIPFSVILSLLTVLYYFLHKYSKTWLIVPFAAILSVLISWIFGVMPSFHIRVALPSFSPSYWWQGMWGTGFGFRLSSIARTLPFALFIILLWAVDTISVTTMLDANYTPGEVKEEINLDRSMTVTSLRNMIGGIFGGAQTSALWRSFLIPLFMVKRPLRPASILLGVIGILAGFSAFPVKLLSFPPLIWSVLMFGIFLPFVMVGLRNLRSTTGILDKSAMISAALLGTITSPILCWVSTVIYERFVKVCK